MGKVMTCCGFTIRELKNGRFSVTRNIPGFRVVHEVFNSFNDCGSEVFEMAPNNDVGSEVNMKMCRVFGRSFCDEGFGCGW